MTMNILNLNTNDISGGAARAAYRLHQGLKSIGLKSQMLVQSKVSDDDTVISSSEKGNKLDQIIIKAIPTLDGLPKNFYRQREKKIFSVQWYPSNIHRKINALTPDIVNLHWINQGFIPIQNLPKINASIVWTLHDMWTFTGGCHYVGECELYHKKCGNCPQLGSHKSNDLSRQIWQQKQNYWHNKNITIVTPSHWLAECAKKSSLFQNHQIEVIANGIDTNIYKPIHKKIAREILNLPQDQKLILFGAMGATSDKRKGFSYLAEALQKLSSQNQKQNFELVIFGASHPKEGTNFPFKAHYLGRLGDDISLALIYSAADVFVAPSMEDNLPNTIMEALSCATPCVAFNIGGMPDMIQHQYNGYLANGFSVDELTEGISWILADSDRHQKLSENARKTVEEKFTLKHQAKQYLELYQNILEL